MNDQYPVEFKASIPERPSRGYALMFLLFLLPKLVILVPHLVILWGLSIAMFAAAIFAQFAVLFTAKYPPKLFHFVSGVQRWHVRVNSFLLGLTDKYPPFSLD